MSDHLISPGLLQQDEHGDLIFTGASWDEHIQAWQEVQGSVNEHMWALGAIGDSLARSYGDADIKRFAQEIGLSHQRIYQLVHTYRGWRGKRKSLMLTHTHHYEALAAPDPQAALDWAEDTNASTRRLAAYARALKDGEAAAEEAAGDLPALPEGTDSLGSIVIPQEGAELKAWMSRIRSRRCLIGVNCAGPTEFAHLEGIPSSNFYGFLARRDGLGMWPGIPLCAHHHRTSRQSIHEVGEEAFVMEHFGGYKRAFGYVIRELVGFLLESRQASM